MNKTLWMTVFAALLGSASVQAAEHILVASSRSNSLEEFDTNGNWLRTFATTGPYGPVALAQSPTTGEIFVTTMWASGPQVGQLTNKILRYQPDGGFYVDWDTFTVECGLISPCPTTQTQSLLFDSSGNLWVATSYGTDLGAPIYIFKYLATDLGLLNPPAQPSPIQAKLYRGGQMAFNSSGDLCIASFIDGDVQCFDTSTGAKTYDYSAEISASGLAIEPGGLAFDGANRLYLTSIFTGQLAKEVNPGGPIELLATLTASPYELNGNLVFRLPCAKYPCIVTGSASSHENLYTTAFSTAPVTFSTPDPAFKVSLSGAVTDFISEAAPPALGNDHIWGAYWMIFISPPPGPSLLVTP
jgi:hypothetical protein